MKKHPYYNYAKILSFNAVFNFIIGGRGLGKTYGAKKKAINDFIKKGDQFIYLRRYKTELKAARLTFFDDLIANGEFKDYEFRINGFIAQMSLKSEADNKKRTWDDIGYFIALSTSQKEKSVAFPNVKTIIYDEFIIEKGLIQYISDEATVFQNFYSTVDRWQDKTKVLFLANSVSITNPYFIKYGIEPQTGDEFIKKNNLFIIVHFPDSQDFSASVLNTRFGQFIEGTDYADYAVNNEFADNNENLLTPKNSRARYQFTLEAKNGIFSVWFDMFSNKYYIQARRPKDEKIFTLMVDKMSEDKTLMSFSDRPLALLRGAYKTAMVYFDKPSTRNAFTEIFKR